MRTLILAVLVFAPVWLRAQTPVITNQPASAVVWSGATATFKVGVSGAGSLTYQWLFDSNTLPPNIISTIAGGGIGDNGSATNANLWTPAGIAIDAVGNVFIADEQNNRIRKVSTNGVITTVVGNGLNPAVLSAVRPENGLPVPRDIPPITKVSGIFPNFSGDGGPATNATVYRPTDVVLDAAGDLLIADMGNNRIRKVDTNGIITTIAGNGTATFAGDGGAATNASLYSPASIALDANGNLFIADANNNVIREVDLNGDISTVVGTNSYGFSGDGGPATEALLSYPTDVAFDSHGNLFISDNGNQRVRKVATTGIISTYAGTNTYGFFGDGGQATNAALWNPGGLTFDSAGNLYVADSSNSRIRKIGANGIITTVVGTNAGGFFGDGLKATNAALYNPLGIEFDSKGNLYIADAYNDRVRKVGTTDLISTFAGNGSPYFSGDGGPASASGISQVTSLALDSRGNLFLADLDNSRIRRIGTNGIITTYAGKSISGYSGDHAAATNASLSYPIGIAMDTAGDVFVADELNDCIRKIATNGIITTVAGTNVSGFSGDGGSATNALLGGPSGVAVDAAGNIYIADAGNQRIRKVNTKGIITTIAGNGAKGIYLIGTYSGDGGAATNAGFSNPSAVAVDAAGNVYIADSFNYRVRKVGTNGVVTTFAGNGTRAFAGDGAAATNASVGLVFGLSVDASNNVYIADTSNNRIRQVNAAGIINTIAGDGAAVFSGDGGPAKGAGLNQPYALLPDSEGNWYIADSGNQRVRKVTSLTPGPVLTLPAVSADQAGDYQFIISNASGSVTSSVASLFVVSDPFIYQADRNANGSLALSFVSEPASTNVVLAATNLSATAVWLPIATNVAAATGDWQFTDTNTARFPKRFYRFLMKATP